VDEREPVALPRPEPVAAVVERFMREQLADLERLAPGVGSPDHLVVHDLRVATRRLRVALALVGGHELGPVRTLARDLEAALGGLRDLHVQLEWLEEPDEEHRHAKAIVASRERARLGAKERSFRRAWRRWTRRAIPELSRWLTCRHVLRDAVVPDGVRKAVKRLDRAVEKLGEGVDPRRAHTARICAKKLRYLLKIVRPIVGTAAEPALAKVASLQTSLGELHDLDVRLGLLTRRRSKLPRAERPGVDRLMRYSARARTRKASAVWSELCAWRRERVARDLARSLEHA
jgi:CHAD domain-containing protein